MTRLAHKLHKFFIIICLIFLTSCAGSSYNDVKRVGSKYKSSVSHLNSLGKAQNEFRIKSRYSKYKKPTYSLKPGASHQKHTSNYKRTHNKFDDENKAESFANHTTYKKIEIDDGYYDLGENLNDDEQYIGHYKVGNSYKVFGKKYHPQEYDSFVEEGMASWYGKKFHGKKTANGEIYDMNTLTAAHLTLPMPSIVKVTNLENNKSIIVRINDRGPFAKNRIIDLSKKAAQILGFANQGTTKVRVELLKEKTMELLKELNLD